MVQSNLSETQDELKMINKFDNFNLKSSETNGTLKMYLNVYYIVY